MTETKHNTEQTADFYRCLRCLHHGPAIGTHTEQRHPHGDGYATETLIEDLRCEECGSEDVYILDETL